MRCRRRKRTRYLVYPPSALPKEDRHTPFAERHEWQRSRSESPGSCRESKVRFRTLRSILGTSARLPRPARRRPLALPSTSRHTTCRDTAHDRQRLRQRRRRVAQNNVRTVIIHIYVTRAYTRNLLASRLTRLTPIRASYAPTCCLTRVPTCAVSPDRRLARFPKSCHIVP